MIALSGSNYGIEEGWVWRRPALFLDVVRSTHEYREPDEARLAQLAHGQHGVVSTAQLHALGFSRQAIYTRRGRLLHRVHRGVYAVGHTRLSPKGRRMAAVLACGPGAVLSHRAAAGLHGVYHPGSGLIDVTAATRHNLPGIRCHSVRQPLDGDDRTIIDGIPVTSLARTGLDCAETLISRQLQAILENAERQEKLNLLAFDALIARSPGRHGIKPLTQALANLRDDPPWTQSELEDAFLQLIQRAGLPTPLTNQIVEGFLVDAYWPEHNLVVEVDGWKTHKTKRAFEVDRQRAVKLEIAGYRVARFTRDRIMNHPAEVARDLRMLLIGPKPASVRVISSSSANLDSSRERRSPR